METRKRSIIALAGVLVLVLCSSALRAQQEDSTGGFNAADADDLPLTQYLITWPQQIPGEIRFCLWVTNELDNGTVEGNATCLRDVNGQITLYAATQANATSDLPVAYLEHPAGAISLIDEDVVVELFDLEIPEDADTAATRGWRAWIDTLSPIRSAHAQLWFWKAATASFRRLKKAERKSAFKSLRNAITSSPEPMPLYSNYHPGLAAGRKCTTLKKPYYTQSILRNAAGVRSAYTVRLQGGTDTLRSGPPCKFKSISATPVR